jgi:hypothetical protein
VSSERAIVRFRGEQGSLHIFGIIGVILIVFLLYQVYHLIFDYKEIEERTAETQRKLEALEAEVKTFDIRSRVMELRLASVPSGPQPTAAPQNAVK